MRCDELRELIPLGTLGILPPKEQAALREHLTAGCPHCAAEMAAARETFNMLPFALEPETPSPMAKARLMAAVRAESAPGPRTPVVAARTGWRTVIAGAAMLAAVVMGYVMVVRQQRVIDNSERVIATLRAQLDRQGEELAALTQQMRAARESIQFVSSPGVLTVDLSGQGNMAESAARVFWDRRRDSWQLYPDRLPAPATGRTYQLWLVTNTGVKISAGTFEPQAMTAIGGRVVIPPGTGNVIVAAITDEPSGGSPQPTTQPFLLGNI